MAFIEGTLKNIYYSPRFQETMHAFDDLVKTGVGAGMTFSTGGVAGPLGWPIMAHGLDHYMAGMNTVLSGIPRDTVSSQLLQQIGMSPKIAGFVDNSFSIVGNMGGTAAFKIYGKISLTLSAEIILVVAFKRNYQPSSGVQSTKVNGPRVNKLMPYPNRKAYIPLLKEILKLILSRVMRAVVYPKTQYHTTAMSKRVKDL